jgi:hypothetical protein
MRLVRWIADLIEPVVEDIYHAWRESGRHW